MLLVRPASGWEGVVGTLVARRGALMRRRVLRLDVGGRGGAGKPDETVIGCSAMQAHTRPREQHRAHL